MQLVHEIKHLLYTNLMYSRGEPYVRLVSSCRAMTWQVQSESGVAEGVKAWSKIIKTNNKRFFLFSIRLWNGNYSQVQSFEKVSEYDDDNDDNDAADNDNDVGPKYIWLAFVQPASQSLD